MPSDDAPDAERIARELRERAGHTSVEVWTGDLMCQAADALEQTRVSENCFMAQAQMFQGLMTKAVQRAEKAQANYQAAHKMLQQQLSAGDTADARIAELEAALSEAR